MQNFSLPLLTVVVPVYNTESYLIKCLDSLVYQTYKNIEILIINDFSQDNSERIILQYAKNHSNIKYIKNEENFGVGYCRKIGAEKASGEIIGYIDSDDWVELDFYERLIYALVNNQSDIAIGSVITEYNNFISEKPRYTIRYDDVISGDYALKIMTKFYKQNFDISPNMNNRIYTKKLLVDNNVCNDFSKQAQDNYSSFMAFVNSEKVSLVANTFYHYYQREGSAVHSFSERYINNYFNVLEHIKEDLDILGIFSKYKDIYMSFIDRSLIWIFQCMSASNSDSKMQKLAIKTICKRCINIFTVEEYIDYFDTNRFYKFFAL